MSTVLQFARPARDLHAAGHSPLHWSWGADAPTAETLLPALRDQFEVSGGAVRFIRELGGTAVIQTLQLVRPAAAFAVPHLLSIDQVHELAPKYGLALTNPLSVLSWAILSFNPNLEQGEIDVGMTPIEGHYLVFKNRGRRVKPRLILQPHEPRRLYPPDCRWILASM